MQRGFYRQFKYFTVDVDTTVEDVKIAYRNLAIKHHPDMGGSTEIMAAINAEFDAACKLVGSKHRASNGSIYESEKPDIVGPAFRTIIDTLLKHAGKSTHIEIVGTFVWVSGDTRPVKDVLKSMGFRWAPAKQMWYKSPTGYVRKHKEAQNMESIRRTYGVRFDNFDMQYTDTENRKEAGSKHFIE